MGMNKWTGHGHVGKDPELKTKEGGTALCRFSFATTETWLDKDKKKQSRTEWHQIVCWGALAERAAKFITKGKELLIEGKIEYQQVDDKNNPGKKITFTNIKMINFDFCGKNDNSNYRPDPEEPGYIPADNSSDDTCAPSGSNGAYDDSDIPF